MDDRTGRAVSDAADTSGAPPPAGRGEPAPGCRPWPQGRHLQLGDPGRQGHEPRRPSDSNRAGGRPSGATPVVFHVKHGELSAPRRVPATSSLLAQAAGSHTHRGSRPGCRDRGAATGRTATGRTAAEWTTEGRPHLRPPPPQAVVAPSVHDPRRATRWPTTTRPSVEPRPVRPFTPGSAPAVDRPPRARGGARASQAVAPRLHRSTHLSAPHHRRRAVPGYMRHPVPGRTSSRLRASAGGGPSASRPAPAAPVATGPQPTRHAGCRSPPASHRFT